MVEINATQLQMRQAQMENKKSQPIMIAYGLSGSGKTRLILSLPDIFDRPSVAIHGHPREYAQMAKAKVFGFERRPLSSDPATLKGVLDDAAIDLLVIDEASQAVASLGDDLPEKIVASGKAALILAQGAGEALDLARLLTARRGGIYAEGIEIEKGCLMGSKEEYGDEINPILFPVIWPNALKAACAELFEKTVMPVDKVT